VAAVSGQRANEIGGTAGALPGLPTVEEVESAIPGPARARIVGPRTSYTVKRLLAAIATVLVASFVVFCAVHAIPGNPFLNDPTLKPNQAAAAMRRYGLNRPVLVQYWSWLRNALHGSLGVSYTTPGLDLTPYLLGQLGVSAILGSAALFIAIVWGVVAGVVAAVWKDSIIDRVVSTLAVVGYSMPSYVVAIIVLDVSVVYLYHLTGGGFFEEIGWGKIGQVPLPAACIAWPVAGYLSRLVRASMIEVASEDFVRTAYAKGLRRFTIIRRYLLRNALVSVFSVSGPLVAGILTGSLVIENLFGIPGLGKEFADSITTLDYNAVVDVFTLYAGLVAVGNLAADLILPIIDPRILMRHR